MKMASKVAILILGILAMVLLISSEVTARDLDEASPKNAEDTAEAKELNDAKYDGRYDHGGRGGYPGHGGYGGGYPGHGGYGGGYPGRGGYGGGGRCYYGCCGGLYYGRCRRCCSYAGEVAEAQTEVKPHN